MLLVVGHDPLVAVLTRLLGGAQLQSVEGAGTGQRMAPVPLAGAARSSDVVAAHGEGQQAVVAQAIVVRDVLIAEHESEQALGEQVLERMLTTARIAVIDEAGSQTLGQAAAMVGGPQQEGTAIGGHATAVKAGLDFAAAVIGEIDRDTVCGHGACFLVARKLLITNMLPQLHAPCHPHW